MKITEDKLNKNVEEYSQKLRDEKGYDFEYLGYDKFEGTETILKFHCNKHNVDATMSYSSFKSSRGINCEKCRVN